MFDVITSPSNSATAEDEPEIGDKCGDFFKKWLCVCVHTRACACAYKCERERERERERE